jgi:tetratricopeptide (TPR) repeat protein
MLGRTDEARAINRESIVRAERILALNPLDGRVLSLGSGALQDDGQLERAFEWSRRSLELYPDDMSTLMNAACMQAKLGKKDAAIEFLERAMGRGWGKLDWIANDPDYDILRDDPRFQRLLTKLK